MGFILTLSPHTGNQFSRVSYHETEESLNEEIQEYACPDGEDPESDPWMYYVPSIQEGTAEEAQTLKLELWKEEFGFIPGESLIYYTEEFLVNEPGVPMTIIPKKNWHETIKAFLVADDAINPDLTDLDQEFDIQSEYVISYERDDPYRDRETITIVTDPDLLPRNAVDLGY